MRTALVVALSMACAGAPTALPPFASVVDPPPAPGETRGFLDVPFDWEHPGAARLRVFYRVLGDDPARPLLVFVNGGPGLPSTNYVSLDHSTDVLRDLESNFRVVVFDQRGTGLSSPIDVESPALDPRLVVTRFGSPQHARDLAALVDRLVPRDQKWFLLSHSYGGQIAFQYLSIDGARRPDGVVFAAPALPFVEPLDAYLDRRLAQRALNIAVLGQRPDLQAKVLRLKDRIRREAFVGPDGTPLRPGMAGAWWRQLEPTPAAAQKLEKWLDRMLEAPITEVEQDIHARLGLSFNLMTNMLVVTDLYGATIARRIAKTNEILAERGLAFEPWMLHEAEAAMNEENIDVVRGGKFSKLLRSLDALEPLRTYPPLDPVRRSFAQIPVLYVTGDADSALPFAPQQRQFAVLADKNHSSFVALHDRGHGAIFSPDSAKLVADWARSLR